MRRSLVGGFLFFVVILSFGSGVKAEEGSKTVNAKAWNSWSFKAKPNDILRWDINTDGPLVDIYVTVTAAYSELQDKVVKGESVLGWVGYKVTGVSHSSVNFTVPRVEEAMAAGSQHIMAVYNPNSTEVLLTYKVELEVADGGVAIPIIPVLGALLLLGLIRRRQSKP